MDSVPIIAREMLYSDENEWRLVELDYKCNDIKLPIDSMAHIEQYVSDESTIAITYTCDASWYLFVQNASNTLLYSLEETQIAAPLLSQGKLYIAIQTDDLVKVYEIINNEFVCLFEICAEKFTFRKGMWTVCNNILYYISLRDNDDLCGDLVSWETGLVINKKVEFVGTYGDELVWRIQSFPLLYKIMIGDGRKGRVIHSNFWLEIDTRTNAFDISADGIIMIPVICSEYYDVDLYFVNINTGEWSMKACNISRWNMEKSRYAGVNFEFIEDTGMVLLEDTEDTGTVRDR